MVFAVEVALRKPIVDLHTDWPEVHEVEVQLTLGQV